MKPLRYYLVSLCGGVSNEFSTPFNTLQEVIDAARREFAAPDFDKETVLSVICLMDDFTLTPLTEDVPPLDDILNADYIEYGSGPKGYSIAVCTKSGDVLSSDEMIFTPLGKTSIATDPASPFSDPRYAANLAQKYAESFFITDIRKEPELDAEYE